MAGLMCSKCGERMYYHGEPNGIQYIVFTEKMWNTVVNSVYDENDIKLHTEWDVPEPYLYQADTIWCDFIKQFREAWVCPHCNSIVLFKEDRIFVDSIYYPINKKIILQESKKDEFIVFSDYTWDEITELSIPTKEIPKHYIPTYKVIANEKYLWITKPNTGEIIRCYEKKTGKD